jgi:polyhydroxyalkanoate synthase
MNLAQAKSLTPESAEESSLIVDSMLGANPLAERDGRAVLDAYRDLAAATLAQPARLWSGLLRWGFDLVTIAAGTGDFESNPRDQRFNDPTWKENPFFRRLRQSYVAFEQVARDMIDEKEKQDWKAAARRRFALQLLIDALAPTNLLAGNPAALKRAFETGGQSLLDGLRNFIDDLQNNGGMPSQVDKRPFKIGSTIATTPGSVIYRDELCEVLQYKPVTRQVRERPALLIPPQINKFYIMDLAPHRSLTEYAVAHGIQFFTISWRNPGSELADKGLDDYVAAIEQASSVVREVTGSPDLNLLAVCAGALTTALATAHLTAIGDPRVNSATLIVTMLDTEPGAMTGMFATEEALNAACLRARGKGILEAAVIGRLFAWLRPNDLVWNYWVNNYLMGKTPAPFDILYWNSDGTNLPAALHAGFLELLVRNSLREPGKVIVRGIPINLKSVTHDLYLISGQTDHICPWQAGYRATGMFGGKAEFVLNSSGHVQSLVSPPDNLKSRYFTNPRWSATPAAWLASAGEHNGSWWDHWIKWLDQRSGEMRPAPEKLGAASFPPLEPAPGSYVHQAA